MEQRGCTKGMLLFLHIWAASTSLSSQESSTSSLLVHASCLLPSTYFGPAQLAKHLYSLFSEEPGNTILANVLPVLQQLAHCILHVGKDMSLSCKQKRKSKEKWERFKKKKQISFNPNKKPWKSRCYLCSGGVEERHSSLAITEL